jgi:hypothetical protein
MKKRVYYFVALLCALALLAACSRMEPPKQTPAQTPEQSQSPETMAPEITRNSTLEILNLDVNDEKALAAIVNCPDEETLAKVPSLKTYNEDEDIESMLLVPVENGSRVELVSLEWDNEKLNEVGTAFVTEKTEDGYGLFVRAVRTEGAPYLKIVVESPKGERGEYLIVYNGRDGTPEIEYITAE